MMSQSTQGSVRGEGWRDCHSTSPKWKDLVASMEAAPKQPWEQLAEAWVGLEFMDCQHRSLLVQFWLTVESFKNLLESIDSGSSGDEDEPIQDKSAMLGRIYQ
jgi:hypothetical protein